VIVPTRDRPDTLRHTLRTCVMQDYERFEILVSDNCSEPETGEVIAAMRDPRVRHLRTERRIAMSHNWEFALGHVQDGLVLVVGDDDALLPNAIRDIVRILGETRCDAIAWRETKYRWPGSSVDRSTLRMCTRTGWHVESAREMLRKVVRYERYYTSLPSLYWGAIDLDVLRRATGPSKAFFHSLNPDLYSGVAAAMALDRYVFSERPYRINGLSKHSTGLSFSAIDKTAQSPRNVFLSEGNLPFHPDYVLVPSSPVYVAEAYQQARDHVPGGNEFPPIAVERVITEMVRAAANGPSTVYPAVIDGVREIAKRAGCEREATALIARYPYRRDDPAKQPTIGRPMLALDCEDFAVNNVYDAAQLCYSIVRLYEAGYLSPVAMAKRALSTVRGRLGDVTRS
jgi:hypothetical protein